MHDDELRYPIGRYEYSGRLTADDREATIARIASLPDRLDSAVAGLTTEQWETSYRPGGWTVRQVVHHLPDSHLHGYIRSKTALAEDRPTIRPFDEATWAVLADTLNAAPEVSLRLLRSLHERWTILLRSLRESDFDRSVYHPEQGWLTLDHLVVHYAWHGDHHLAHITALAARQAWFLAPPNAARQ